MDFILYIAMITSVVACFFGCICFQLQGIKDDCNTARTAIIQTSNQVDKANAYYYDCMEEKQ